MHNNIIFLFQISYKQGQEQEQGEYNYPATLTPGYQSQRKLDPLKDVSPLKLVQTPIYPRSPTQFWKVWRSLDFWRSCVEKLSGKLLEFPNLILYFIICKILNQNFWKTLTFSQCSVFCF